MNGSGDEVQIIFSEQVSPGNHRDVSCQLKGTTYIIFDFLNDMSFNIICPKPQTSYSQRLLPGMRGMVPRQQDLFYFAQKSGEVVFLVCRGLSVQEMIQVTHSDLSEEDAKARELAPLTAADLFPDSQRTLITYDWPDAEIPQSTKNLRLWEWLLDSA
jgi:hypothetical protein